MSNFRSPNRTSSRRLFAESLESRRLLAVTPISLADFDSASTLDFESAPAGIIAPGSNVFSDFGISSVQRFGNSGNPAAETYDASPGATRALWGRGNDLLIVDPGSATLVDQGSIYILEFAQPQTKVGFSIGDYSNGNAILVDFRDSSNTQLDTDTPVFSSNSLNEYYYESDTPFVKITIQATVQAGFAIDNLTLEGDNIPPVAIDDTATTDEDTSATIDVVANDSDSDGSLDISSVSVVSSPANGTAVYNGDGTFTYTPDVNFNGSDTFTYSIADDAGASTTASVGITVNSVIDAVVEVNPFNGNREDRINLHGFGFIFVSIASTQQSSAEVDDFDVTQQDWSQASYSVNGTDVSAAFATDYFDLDGDGDRDLLLAFSKRELRNALSAGDVDFVLGVEFGAAGGYLSGADSVSVKKRRGW